jgi:AcrR family transcriptional regulator
VTNGRKNNNGKAMGRKERRLREQQELKHSILDAAREIALAEGWRNVTMRKIADRIEYSHPAIYDYFENKDVLLLELVHEGFRLLEAALHAAREQAHDPVEALRRVSHGYLAFAWRSPELYRLMYGLDGVTFSISEPEKEGLQIDKVVAETVKEVFESHHWSTDDLPDQVYLLWSTAHGLVALTMANRIGGQAQAMHLLDRAVADMLLAREHDSGAPRPDLHSEKLASL